jgi:hypothetical protein
MKKASFFLLLLIIACGGSSEETTVEDTATTTVQDTTTTTIPPVPTIGFDIIENYNLKLVDELCLGSESIDTVTESCLKQYREDLEWLTRYNDQIQEYVVELNQYFEKYPERLTEDYTTYLSFVENEYSAVFTDYEIVSDKYIERFGGLPVISSLLATSELWNECPATFDISTSENLKSGYLTFKNINGEILAFTVEPNKILNLNLNTQGGTFYFHSGTVLNYLDESFELTEIDNDKFFVNHWGPIVQKVTILSSDENSVTIEFIWEDGVLKMEAISVLFERQGLNEKRFQVLAATLYGKSKSNYDAYWFNWGTYITEEPNRIVYKHPFKSFNGIDLDSNPFYIYHLLDFAADTGDGTFANYKPQKNKGDQNIRRKVGCNGESSVKTVRDSAIDPLDFSDLVFNR